MDLKEIIISRVIILFLGLLNKYVYVLIQILLFVTLLNAIK